MRDWSHTGDYSDLEGDRASLRDDHSTRGDNGDMHDVRDDHRNRHGDIDDRRHQHYNRKDDVTRKVKIEAPTFDGTYDPRVFSDWLEDTDHYFDWYGMDD